MSLIFVGPISLWKILLPFLSMCQYLSVNMCSGASQGQKLLAVLESRARTTDDYEV